MESKKRKWTSKKTETGIMIPKGWGRRGGVMLFKGTYLQLIHK